MPKRSRISRPNLPARMVLSFVFLVGLSALAVGLPAIWLIRGQLDQQSWEMVAQGQQNTRAYYDARSLDLTNLAILTAQRPTLQFLVDQMDLAGLEAYLETLRSGASLDGILVCNGSDELLAVAGRRPQGDVCRLAGDSPYAREDSQHLWMVAEYPVEVSSSSPGKVLVGILLDDDFALQMSQATGLEQFLLVDGLPVAASLPDASAIAASISPVPQQNLPDNSPGLRFVSGGLPYFAARLPLNNSGVEALVARPVGGIAQTQRQLTEIMAAGMLVVAVLGSAAGILLARRISKPLNDLARVAVRLQSGDLDTPVSVQNPLPEVATVAFAMEDARVALHHTLGQLSQEKAWIEHLLESIVEGVLTLDQHGRITYFSHGAERISGWSGDQTIGRSFDEIFPAIEESESFSRFLPAPGRQSKITVNLKNGRQATLAVTGASLAPPEAGKARKALVVRDVSDEEIIHRLLGDFLANVAHEFRTPLSALAASMELLLDQLGNLSPDELQELLGSIHLGTLSLQNLIDNLLEGASIEAGRFRVYPRQADLTGIIMEAVATMQPLVTKYDQRLLLDIPADLPAVQVDSRRTVQVVTNLISNAVKYAPAGTEIHLSVCPKAGGVRVSVADQGSGLPTSDGRELFRRFVHLGSGTPKAQSGVGLGLSVVKAIVEAQGGQVGATSRPDGGSVFWFTVPLAEKSP